MIEEGSESLVSEPGSEPGSEPVSGDEATRPSLLRSLEDGLVSFLLALMVILPLIEVILRRVDSGIPSVLAIVQHLTLWVAFLGAVVAAREDRLLSLATGEFVPRSVRPYTRVLTYTVSAAVSALLCFASASMVNLDREFGEEMGLGIPIWIAQIVMPIAFGWLALRFVWAAGSGAAPGTGPGGSRKGKWGPAVGRTAGLLGLLFGIGVGLRPESFEGATATPALLVILLATLLGAPIFVALGGVALVLFLVDAVPPAAVPAEMYRLAVSPTLAAIPLFTLTGFLLAEGKASERLLQVFRALFGWLSGGTAVVCAVVCAFFTVFTGGSGVTILALGGVLLPALLADGYRERFSLGLLTASGSLGLLLPPALPLILYGIVAEISIEDLFIGGIIPGLLMIVLIGLWGFKEGRKNGVSTEPFVAADALAAVWKAKWELLLPAVILVAIFSGWATVVEAAAIAAFYALVIQVVIHRDVKVGRELFSVFQKCTVLIGGVLIILCVAMGLSNWMVDAQIASQLVDFAEENIHSKWVFLLCLNLFLLAVGCLMDIFAATVVVVPLIVPLGAAFGIHPVHLGIIFIANLELGYLTPPVGLNLFLSSYRFDRPLLEIYRAVLPALVILGIGVLLITYVPALTLGLLSLRGGG